MQQKVILALWLLQGPRLWLLDEPTRCVGIGTHVRPRVACFFEEVIGIASRIVVLSSGDATDIPSRLVAIERPACSPHLESRRTQPRRCRSDRRPRSQLRAAGCTPILAK
jgi:hypothetical protein